MFRARDQKTIVTGLDIGSSSIRIAIGQASKGTHGKADVHIVGAVEVQSQGIHKGNITSLEETVSSIAQALEKAEHLVGMPIEHVWVGISGDHIMCQESKGVVAAAKSDGEISEDDVDRAVEAARSINPPLNYEVLHVIPKSYTVDGQSGMKDPVGMTGIRLEVDAQVIHGATPHLKNITKAVYRTGLDIDDVILSILASGDVAATHKQKELGCVVVNIGGSTTTLIIYEDGNILHTATLPIGSDHVTNDLALGLQTDIAIAEKVKSIYGHCFTQASKTEDIISLHDVGSQGNETVSKKYIVEIIHARMAEILEKVDAELQKMDRSHLLPAGAIFIGGGSKIPGLVELAKQTLGMNASLGYPVDVQTATEKGSDIAFTPVIGLVHWGAQSDVSRGPQKRFAVPGASAVGDNVKKLMKFLMP